MTDADRAYQIAENRIAQAKAKGWDFLSLSGSDQYPYKRGSAMSGDLPEIVWPVDTSLKNLERIPPSIRELENLTWLYLNETRISSLKYISYLLNIEVFTARNTRVRDLNPISRMSKLSVLNLENTLVDDLTPLKKMRSLKKLWLGETPVSVLDPLSGLHDLEQLELGDTRVKDLKPIQNLTNLRVLFLAGTNVNELSPLSQMNRLERLFVSSTDIGDVSILSEMFDMKELGLGNTRVVDLKPLQRMTKLERLYLRLTDARISDLVSAGSAWEKDNHSLELFIRGMRFDDPILNDLAIRSENRQVGSEILDRLREIRDLDHSQKPFKKEITTQLFTFLSYAHTDQPAASRLKSALEEEGLSIWWDQMIDPGADWDAELRRRVTSAHSVLVLWSEASAASEHVRDEAQRARRANTVAPVMIEPLSEDQLPQPFGGRHTLDLSHWDGSRDDDVFQRLVKFLKHRQAGADSPLTVDATEDGDIRLRERPVGAAPERQDDVTRDRLIGAQVKLAERTAAQARRAPNAPPDLPDRLDEYVEELKAEGDKFWEVIDDAFAPAAGLLKPEELTDD